MRLIDADALKEHYSWWPGKVEVTKEDIDTIVDIQPTVKPPIVHCGDCMCYDSRHFLCEHFNAEMGRDDYCSYGY